MPLNCSFFTRRDLQWGFKLLLNGWLDCMWKDRDKTCLGADRVANVLPDNLDTPGPLTGRQRGSRRGGGGGNDKMRRMEREAAGRRRDEELWACGGGDRSRGAALGWACLLSCDVGQQRRGRQWRSLWSSRLGLCSAGSRSTSGMSILSPERVSRSRWTVSSSGAWGLAETPCHVPGP